MLEFEDLFEVDVLKFEPKYHDDHDKLVRHSSQLNPYLNPFEDSFSKVKPFFKSAEGKILLVKSFNSIQFLLNEGKVSNQVLYHIQNTLVKFMKSQLNDTVDETFDPIAQGVRLIDNVVFLSKYQNSLFNYKTRTNSMYRLFQYFEIDENETQMFEHIEKLNQKELLKDMTVEELSIFLGSEVVSQTKILGLLEEKNINQKIFSIFEAGNEKVFIKILNSIEKYTSQKLGYDAIKIFLREKIQMFAELKNVFLSQEELTAFFYNIERKVGDSLRSSHLDKLFSQFGFDGNDRSFFDVEDFKPVMNDYDDILA